MGRYEGGKCQQAAAGHDYGGVLGNVLFRIVGCNRLLSLGGICVSWKDAAVKRSEYTEPLFGISFLFGSSSCKACPPHNFRNPHGLFISCRCF